MIERHPVEANVWAMHRDFARNPTTVVNDDADLLWFNTAGSNSWLNGASWCALGQDVDARIASVGHAAQQVGTKAQWTTSPSCGPGDLERHLDAAGWRPEVVPAMAVAVDTRFPSQPAELAIQKVVKQSEVREWTDLFDASFGIEPRGDKHPWLEPWRHLALGAESPCRLFLGRLDGVPVSCSMAFVHQDSVGLYGVGTPPPHRGNGYASALTVAGIRWGASRGASVAVLHASPLGAPVYQSLGFRVVLDMIAWSLPLGDQREATTT
ncbi:acetyltransferase (GNAT) family protein [Oryzihumus leptocrescens]|uniref:Acetyltransferase (GNAT) family protein n=2 Tax=Oryzihumus leptocrescens TaxID=297536 RepID=A0A542ZNK5_9MICO|nr:acetyltransferase (GNAT) family protein [Oryzihumus leptocrescens]